MDEEYKIPAFMDVSTLAAHMCLDNETVLQWVEQGALPQPIIRNGRKRWRWRDVERAMSGDAGEYSRVYFIQAANGYIKIGYTAELSRRFANIAGGIPLAVTLLHDIPGSYDLENDLHRRFAHLRENGEWFRSAPELLQFIDELKSGRKEMPSRIKLVG